MNGYLVKLNAVAKTVWLDGQSKFLAWMKSIPVVWVRGMSFGYSGILITIPDVIQVTD